MATIRKRLTRAGKAHYQAIVRVKGYPPQVATLRTLSEAKRWAAKIDGELRERRNFGWLEARRRTLAEAIARWERDYSPSLKSVRERINRRQQLAWWAGRMKGWSLSEVTPSAVAELRDELSRNGPKGRPLSNAAVNRYLAALSRVLALCAEEWQWMEANPVSRVSRRREADGRMRILTEQEQEALLAACYEPVLSLVRLALATGMRQGEMLALRWPDVDLSRRLALVRNPKNRRDRSVPLSPAAVDLLRALVRRVDDDRVFPFTWDHKAWERTLKRAGIAGFRFHDLRHTAASHLAMSGATPLELAEILGHRTLAMVRRYAHFFESHLQAVVDRAAGRFLPGAPRATP